MNYRLSLAIVAALALTGLFAWTALAGDGAGDGEAAGTTTSTLHVTGMTCGGCEVGVRRVVNKLDGVEEVEASYKAATATVTYQPDKVTLENIIAAIEELGYTAELATADAEGT